MQHPLLMQDWNADNFTDFPSSFLSLMFIASMFHSWFWKCSSQWLVTCDVLGISLRTHGCTYWQTPLAVWWKGVYRLFLECTTSSEQVRRRTVKEGRGEGKQSLSERRRKKDSSLKRGKKTKQRRKSFPLSLPPKNDDDDKTEMCTCGGATPKKKKHYVI